MERPLALSVEQQDGATVVSVAGEVDMITAPKLRECLLATQGDVVVDLSAVSFLDSSGIAALINARSQLDAAGGNLTLRNPKGLIRRALEIIGLADWIED